VSWLLLVLAAGLALVWRGRVARSGGEWRPAAAVVALAAVVGAGVAGLRSEWLLCAGLLAAGAALVLSARRR
jgi:heme A synthase